MGASPVAQVTLSACPMGQSVRFRTASARRQNGVVEDVTGRATWADVQPQIATVSNGREGRRERNGRHPRAIFEGVQAETSISVRVGDGKHYDSRNGQGEVAPNAVPVAGARVSALVGQSTVTDSSGTTCPGALPAATSTRSSKGRLRTAHRNWLSSTDTQENFTLYPTPPKGWHRQDGHRTLQTIGRGVGRHRRDRLHKQRRDRVLVRRDRMCLKQSQGRMGTSSSRVDASPYIVPSDGDAAGVEWLVDDYPEALCFYLRDAGVRVH